jgi:hypothetical protein
MTNGLVEIALIVTSVVLGVVGLPVLALGAMILVSLIWWSMVHGARFGVMLAQSRGKAIGTLAIACVMIVAGHGLGFVLGRTFGVSLGLT